MTVRPIDRFKAIVLWPGINGGTKATSSEITFYSDNLRRTTGLEDTLYRFVSQS